MELSVYLLFKVNITNLVRDKVVIVKEFYIQPSEIDRMPMWEYEMVREEIMKHLKEREQENEKQQKGYDPSSYKMPKMPQYKTPTMPKSNFKM